jgi:hypothetical protein
VVFVTVIVRFVTIATCESGVVTCLVVELSHLNEPGWCLDKDIVCSNAFQFVIECE